MALSLEESTSEFTEQEIIFLNYAVAATNIISILGCVSNIFSTIYLGFHRKLTGKMVMNLALTDLLLNFISILLTCVPFKSPDVCIYVGALERFVYGSSIVWTCCFAYVLRQSLKIENLDRIPMSYKNLALISYFCGLAIGFASYFTEYYRVQDDGRSCGHYFLGMVSTIVVLGVPVLLATLYNFTCYVGAIRKIKEIGLDSHWELILYPIILVICYLPYTIISVIKGQTQNLKLPFWIYLLVDILYNSQGLWNAFAYGFGRKCCVCMKTFICRRKQVREQNNSLGDHIRSSDESKHSENLN